MAQRDECADTTRMPGKPANRPAYMTPLDDMFELPNIADREDKPDGGPLPGKYQSGDPR